MKSAGTSLLSNSRFYILATAFFVSIIIASYFRITIPSDQLFYIRTGQIYGLVAIALWYLVLTVSPIGYVVGKQRIRHLSFARRALGVSAAYFALLHFGVALWGQLGGPSQLQYLPSLFKWSLAGGGVALIVLLLMAVTSFDKVIKFMTFRRWKWLHRLGYIGGILVVIHIWSVSTHISYSGVQIAAFMALVVLAGLETFRNVTLLVKRYPEFSSKEYFATLFVSIWVVLIALVLLIPVVVKNYHVERHSEKVTSSKVSS